MARKVQADCVFRCPIKGYVDFPVWTRKGEDPRQACLRKLKTLIDEQQFPLCEEIRVRSIDGTGRIENLCRPSPPRRKKLPRVRIVRED